MPFCTLCGNPNPNPTLPTDLTLFLRHRFVSKPPAQKPPANPKKVSELEAQKLQEKHGNTLLDPHGQPVQKFTERQWEKVVTRLYGTPGGPDDPAKKRKEISDAKTKKMHPVEIERAVDRLYYPNQHKQEWLLQQRVAILDKELRACRSKPKISKTSERMASGNLHIVNRVDRIISDRQQKMAELISLVEAEEGGQVKGSPYISPRAKGLTRSYKDLINWDAERTERLQQQREAKVVDEISCPFHPEICEHSEELAARRFQKEGLLNVTAEERLYSMRELPTEEMVAQARAIHQEDLKHSLALSSEY